MKFLLETVFSIAMFVLILWALPAIIGIFAIGVILYFVFSPATSSSGDTAGKTQNETYKRYGTGEEQSERNSRTNGLHDSKSKTAERATHYTNDGYSGYRHYENDDYDSRYSSYYDDWDNDDTPPEDDIHFRGTGAPFL